MSDAYGSGDYSLVPVDHDPFADVGASMARHLTGNPAAGPGPNPAQAFLDWRNSGQSWADQYHDYAQRAVQGPQAAIEAAGNPMDLFGGFVGSTTPIGAGSKLLFGAEASAPKAANMAGMSQAEIKDMLGPPQPFMDRLWDNYAKRMTPEEFLQSEPLWGGTKDFADATGWKEHEAFSFIANEMLDRMGATQRFSPESARRYMGQARGIGAVPDEPGNAHFSTTPVNHDPFASGMARGGRVGRKARVAAILQRHGIGA